MSAKHDPIYVGIENPAETRKALLESSKLLITILRENEEKVERRKVKKALIMELKALVDEVNALIEQLKSEMPKVNLSTLPKKEIKTAKQVLSPQPKIIKPREEPISETARFEKELADIEEKLSRLG